MDDDEIEGLAIMNSAKVPMKLKRKTLKAVLDQCQTALQFLSQPSRQHNYEATADDNSRDIQADELCSMLKSRLECPEFLKKLESTQKLLPQNMTKEVSSWDIVSENDQWENGNVAVEDEDYVLVRQEDVVDGIACFMAAYLLSNNLTKDLTPNQLQDALSKTFSLKKKKGKLQKAWDGSKVIYSIASWGATAIGIYQNPAILGAASAAFWTSCQVISKLL